MFGTPIFEPPVLPGPTGPTDPIDPVVVDEPTPPSPRRANPPAGDRLLIIAGLIIGLVLGTILAAAGGVLSPGSAAASAPSMAAARRLARAATVSVSSSGCAGGLLGSGVVTQGGLLVTAAHVAGGARQVEVQSASGTATAHPVLAAPGIDVVSAPVPTSWPSVTTAPTDPLEGTTVVVASRARGHLLVRAARVQTYLRGTGPQDPARVMRLDVGVSPGDSGGPVLDAQGRLVGIVYAAQNVSQLALVIPASELDTALAADGTFAAC